MTELDRLPPDQRAVLSLVLDRGKSYAEVAELLGIPENTVRDRAHTALDALADGVATPGSSRAGSRRGARPGAESQLGERPGAEGGLGDRHGVAGGLGERHGATGGLGELPGAESGLGERHGATGGLGESGLGERHGAMGGLGESGLGERSGAAGTSAASRFGATETGPGSARTNAGVSGAPPLRSRELRGPQASAGSRRAGALLLGAIVVVIVVVVVLVSSGGGKGSTPPTTAASTPTTTGTSSTSTTSATKPKLDSTIRLSSPEQSTNATGIAYVLSDGSRRAFYVTAQGLPPSSGFFYAVWLYDSPSNAEPLGRAPSVGSNGRMQGGNPLPSNAGDYAKLIITRETSSHPSQPGPTVLSGALTLH